MIKLKNFQDCTNLINQRVSFKYHDTIRTGVVKKYSVNNKKVWFEILSDMTNCITMCDMFSIIELTDNIIIDTNPVKFTTEVI
tara:strand:+ start:281 stop:529 length:249 start_codon:yes stop_codon:yes gene_type:complete